MSPIFWVTASLNLVQSPIDFQSPQIRTKGGEEEVDGTGMEGYLAPHLASAWTANRLSRED
jgi:hypothetical protein